MAEAFQEIRIETRSAPTDPWVDIFDRVLHNPRPRVTGIGIMDNRYLSRVGGNSTLSFSIDNSDGNGDALLGEYCRVVFKWDGVEKIKFSGLVVIDSKNRTPGIYGKKDISIRYRGWFGWALDYPLDFLEYATNKRIDEAVPLVIKDLPIQPDELLLYTGDYTFPDVFDITRANSSVVGEFNRLATSEVGYIYERMGGENGGILVVENRLKRTADAADTSIPVYSGDHSGDSLLLEDGASYLLLEDGTSHLLLQENSTVAFDDNDIWIGKSPRFSNNRSLINYAKVSTRPRKVDTANTTVLWTMEGATLVEAGTTISGIRGRYRDPNAGASNVNGINMRAPIRGVDFQAFQNSDGTGADRTGNCFVTAEFGTAEVEISISNAGATDFYVGGEDITFQVRGRGVYLYDATEVIFDYKGVNSFYPYAGRRSIAWDMFYQTDANAMIALFDSVWMKNSSGITCEAFPLLANRNTKNMRGFMYLDAGMRAAFEETQSLYNKSAYINGYSFEIIDGMYVAWTPVLFDQSRAPDF